MAIFVFGCLKAPFHTIELVYSRAIVLLPVPDTPQNVNKKRAADTSTSLLSSLEEASEVALGRTYPQPQQICNLILFCLTFVHLLSLTHIICLDCRFAAQFLFSLSLAFDFYFPGKQASKCYSACLSKAIAHSTQKGSQQEAFPIHSFFLFFSAYLFIYFFLIST